MNTTSHSDLKTIPFPEFYSEVWRRRGINSGGARPGAGRPRSKAKRCPCGAMTLKYAKAGRYKM